MSTTTINVEAVLNDNVSHGLKNMTDQANKLPGSFNETTGSIKGMAAGVIGGMIGFNMLSKAANFAIETIKEGITEYLEFEKTLAVMQFTTKGNADEFEHLQQQAEKLTNTTIYSDDEILKAQTFLTTQGRTESQIKKIIAAATDLSTVTGEGLYSSMRKLDATYEGQLGRLTRLDSSLKQLSKEQLANGDAVTILGKKYDGLAKTVGDTTAGNVQKLSNKWSELKKGLGASIFQLFDTAKGTSFLTESVDLQQKTLNNKEIPAWKRLVGLFDAAVNMTNLMQQSVKNANDEYERQHGLITDLIGDYSKFYGKSVLLNFAMSMKGKSPLEVMNAFKSAMETMKKTEDAMNNNSINGGYDISKTNFTGATAYEDLSTRISDIEKAEKNLLVQGKDLTPSEKTYLEKLKKEKALADKEETKGLSTKTGESLSKTSSIKELTINITKMTGVETLNTTNMTESTTQVGEALQKVLEKVILDSSNIALQK
jgi:hypothetical protein